jgi:hypothetical protein
MSVLELRMSEFCAADDAFVSTTPRRKSGDGVFDFHPLQLPPPRPRANTVTAKSGRHSL